jgi:hypothetical protein
MLAYDPAQAAAFVAAYFQRLPLPLPNLRLSPSDRAVVNLPVIASADPPGQTTFIVSQVPFPTITVNAKVSWRWDWGDGSWVSTDWSGRPYDGTDPRISPGHYVTHIYGSPSPGMRVRVSAVWTATYTIAGIPGAQPIAGAVTRTSSADLPVSEYGATLVGN